MRAMDLGPPDMFGRVVTRMYQFTCPDCGERIIVDRHIRDELLSQGCVVCSSDVQPSHFNLK